MCLSLGACLSLSVPALHAGDDAAVSVSLQDPADPAPAAESPRRNVPELPETDVQGRPAPRPAPEPEPPTEPPSPEQGYGITGRASPLAGTTSSASEGVIGQPELQTRPIPRSTSVLELVPGLMAGDHAGGGEAGQFFLRGMFLDHGNDLSVKVDGIPVNLPTGAIAQGYIDTNFIIPELIEQIRFRIGPYYADVGDFSTAGSVEFQTARSLPYGIAKVQVGWYGFLRGLVADSQRLGAGELLYAFDAQGNDSAFDRPENLRQVRGMFRYTLGDELAGVSASAMLYNSNWFNTLQIAERAVFSGQVPLLGNLSPTDYSTTSRYMGNLEYWNNLGLFEDRAQVYVQHYDVDSYQNFTYFLDDPVNGDQVLFHERRVTVGANLSRTLRADLAYGTRYTVGAQIRYDNAPDSQFNHTAQRVFLERFLQRDFELLNLAGYVENETQWNPQWRTVAGIRADWFQHDVTDRLQAVNTDILDDGILSPKASLIYAPIDRTELFLTAGYAFHTNHAGATTTVLDRTGAPTDPAPLIVRTFGAEIGARTESIEGLQSGLVLFYSHSDSELIFEADEGILEPQRAAERIGIESRNYWRLAEWLTWDADMTASRARFVEFDPAGDYVPNSPTVVLTSGPLVHLTENLYAALRFRYLGPRPLIEDNSVQAGSVSVFNLQLGYNSERLMAAMAVSNLFDSRDRDIEYFYETQLQGEAAPVADRHFRLVEPRSLRFTLAWLF